MDLNKLIEQAKASIGCDKAKIHLSENRFGIAATWDNDGSEPLTRALAVRGPFSESNFERLCEEHRKWKARREEKAA